MGNLARLAGRLLGGRLLPRLAYPILRGTLRGARLVLGAMSGKGGGASVYFGMVEPEQTAALGATLKAGQVFFDIGANVGYYTILGSRLVGANGRVFAFEPAPRNLFYLYRHTLLNKSDNVTILPVACSDTMKLATFSAGDNFAMGCLADKDADSNDDGKFPVVVVSVDEVVRHSGIAPDVIKIDVEGAELAVLKGAKETLLKAKPQVFLSTHSALLRETCLEYLRGCGYEYQALNRDEQNPSEFLAYYPTVDRPL